MSYPELWLRAIGASELRLVLRWNCLFFLFLTNIGTQRRGSFSRFEAKSAN